MVAKKFTHASLVWIGFLTAVAAIGVAAQTPVPNPDLTALGNAVLDPTGEVSPSGDPILAFTPREGTWKYVLTSGTGAGSLVTEALAKVNLGAATVWRRTWDPGHVTDFVVSSDGVFKTRLTDPDHQLSIAYAPGEPELIPGMIPGEKRQFKYSISASRLSDPTQVQATGQIAVDFSYLGRYRIKTAAGELVADGFRKVLTGNVGPGKVDTVLYVFYAAGVGEVARIDHTDFHAFLLYNRDSRTGYLLDQLPTFNGT